MSCLALSRISTFNNKATAFVVLASANRLTAKPMIPLHDDDHSHHGDHIGLPNKPKLASVNEISKTIIGGNLRVSNAFTSK
jgi:hypothetical protein